jgi:hypothetical protein
VKLHCYHACPIDWWDGALTANELLSKMSPKSDAVDLSCAAARLAEIEADARVAFREIGWEGDVSEGPYFFCLPDEGYCSLGYMLKQSNNGSTFVASPQPLPWLETTAFRSRVIECPRERK